jgi:hypothetical protein
MSNQNANAHIGSILEKVLFRLFLSSLAASLILSGVAGAQTNKPPTRGELLYTTHCLDCHQGQIHWRARKRAVDWSSLKFEVARWQKAGGLNWLEADVIDVASYLNSRYYHFATPMAER